MTALASAEPSLADLLRIEDDPAVLAARCPTTGIPLWTLLRIPFLRSILSDVLYHAAPVAGATVLRVPKATATLAVARALAHNLRAPAPRADILIAATGIGNVWDDGRWFNRLSDHFALADAEHTLVIEDLFSWRWPFPRRNDRVLLSAPTQAAAALVGSAGCGAAQRARADGLVDLMSRRARDCLGWAIAPRQAAQLRRWLARKSAALPWLHRHYLALLRRIRPRLLIKEEACYGPSAPFILAARELGIATAEYQHGVVSAGHDAYNVAGALASDPAFRRTLPDVLLGYGRWWLDQVDLPVRKVAIGNPHRSERLGRLPPRTAGARDVLVLGDGIETALYLGLARRLASLVGPSLDVVFRPHPLERDAVRSEFPSGAADGVRIDVEGDIYRSFGSARAVVSDMSTGLFEAVGIVERIFVWNTPKARFTFPRHPFASFDDEGDLARQLTERGAPALDARTVEAIWQPDWQANYARFVAGIRDARIAA